MVRYDELLIDITSSSSYLTIRAEDSLGIGVHAFKAEIGSVFRCVAMNNICWREACSELANLEAALKMGTVVSPQHKT
jgi:hypothetical protein